MSEAARNLLSGTTHLLAVTVALAVITLGAITADAMAVARLVSAAEAFRDSGAGTFILTASAQVSGAACERMNSVGGVTAAGALRRADQDITVYRAPSAPLSTYEATPGMLTALAGEVSQPDGLWLSERSAAALGVAAGDVLRTSEGGIPVAGVFVYPDDGRRPGLGYAAVLPTHDATTYDECWMTVWPPSSDTAALIWSALAELPLTVATSGSDEANIVQLNTTFGRQYTIVDDYLHRPSRHVAPAAAIAAALLGVVCVRLRRVELSVVRRLGLPGGAQAAQIAIETAIPATVAGLLVGACSVVLGQVVPDLGDTLTPADVGLTVALCSGSLLIGTLIGLATIRPRRLFAYLKER